MDDETLKERQRIGIERAKRLGKYKGRKPGATKARPEHAKALKAQGYTVSEIAMKMDVGKRTVWRYLKRHTGDSQQ